MDRATLANLTDDFWEADPGARRETPAQRHSLRFVSGVRALRIPHPNTSSACGPRAAFRDYSRYGTAMLPIAPVQPGGGGYICVIPAAARVAYCTSPISVTWPGSGYCDPAGLRRKAAKGYDP